MPSLQIISPLLDGMVQEAEISSEGGVTVWRVLHQPTGAHFMVKRISIPKSEADTQALILTGAFADEAGAAAYYETIASGYREELKEFRKLAATPGVLGYLRFQIEPKEGAPGFDLYLLAPCRTSLREYLQHNAITKLKAVQLGLDLCRTLARLRENGYLYQDLKPENVFLEAGKFCIGDFGLYPLSDLSYGSLPPRYTGLFSAPELCGTAGPLNKTADLYSVGLLLYYIFNGNHIPFEEAGTTEKAADGRRIAGEALPTPLYADYEMDALIRKACAPKPEDRYQTPGEFLAALTDYRDRNEVTDDCIVPPLCTDDVPIAEPEAEEEPTQPITFTNVETLPEDFKQSFTPVAEPQPEPEPRKKKRLLLPILLLVLVLAAAGFSYYYFVLSAVTVQSLRVVARTADSITVSAAATDLSKLVVTCAAEDGSSAVAYPCAETNVFDGLKAGTAYRITVAAPDWHRVKGAVSLSTATAAYTEIRSFTAQDQQDGSALVTFQVSGPEPTAWTLHAESDAAGAADYPVENHSSTLTGLLPNSVYTLTLVPGDGFYLDGASTISYSYAQPIAASDLSLKGSTDNTVTVAWKSDSTVSTEWTVVCSGDNGYADTIVTDQLEATFEGTATNVQYTVTVTNKTMTVPLILTVQSSSVSIPSFTAELSGRSAHLAWQAEGSKIPSSFVVTYGPVGTIMPRTAETDGTSLNLSGLIPETSYQFTLAAGDGTMLGGTTTASGETAAAGASTDFNGISIFSGLYEATAGWTVGTLGSVQTTFSPGTPIVFVIQPASIPQLTGDKSVEVLLVIRDANGNAVADARETAAWSGMWSGSGAFGASITSVPRTAGSYKLELYFDGALLKTESFAIA